MTTPRSQYNAVAERKLARALARQEIERIKVVEDARFKQRNVRSAFWQELARQALSMCGVDYKKQLLKNWAKDFHE